MRTSYVVAFRHMGLDWADQKAVPWTVSRVFTAKRPARSWAGWLMARTFVREVAIYQGGLGGVRVTL